MQAAFYIRAGEKLNKILLRDGIYFFYIYPGENWSDSIAEFEEKPLPGFAISGKYVGPESRLNRFEPPKIVSSFTGRFLPKKEFEFRRDSIVEVY